MRLLRHLLPVLALLLGAFPIPVAAAGPAAATAPVPRSVSLSATPDGTVEVGDPVALRGRLTRSPRGSAVLLQERRDGRWRTLARTRTTTPRGAWSRTVVPRRPGDWRLRALAPAGRGLARATSPVRSLRVEPVAPREPGVVRRVAEAADRTVLSGDGSWVVVETVEALLPSDQDEDRDVYLVERGTGSTTLVSAAAPGGSTVGDAEQADVSADGRWVVFSTHAALVPDDDDTLSDVYVWDRDGGQPQLVSRVEDRSDGRSVLPSVSADGRWVAFASTAEDLVGAGETSTASQVFVRDLRRSDAGATRLVSRSPVPGEVYPSGSSADPSVASSGSTVTVAFQSTAGLAAGMPDSPTTGQVLVWTRDGGLITTSLASGSADGGPGDGPSYEPDLAADGDHVAFLSRATGLVPGQVDTTGTEDVFVHDLRDVAPTPTTLVTGEDGSATRATGDAHDATVSADGRSVAYVRYDTSAGPSQAYLSDLGTGRTYVVSRSRVRGAADGLSLTPSVSDEGRRVAFASAATDLVSGPPTTSGSGAYVFMLPLV